MPDGATHKAVRDIARRDLNNDRPFPSVNRVAGPAVLFGFAALFARTYFFTVIPFVSAFTGSTCGPETRGFAPSTDMLVWTLFFVPAAMGLLASQQICTRYVLLPMLSELQREGRAFEFIGCDLKKPWACLKGLSFKTWYRVYSFVTCLNLLDDMSNALFTARLVSTSMMRQYTMYYAIQQRWYDAWKKAYFVGDIVTKLGSDYFQFEIIAIMFYALQLVVQPLAALYYTVPFQLHWPAFEVIDDHNNENQGSHYRTLANSGEPGDTTDYHTAVAVLAEANRMEPVTSQDFHQAEAVAMRLKDWVNDHPEYFDELIDAVRRVLLRGFMRFTLKGLVQNAFQLNLQVSLLAVGKSLPHIGLDWFNAFTTVITIIAMLADLPDMMTTVCFVCKIIYCRCTTWTLRDEDRRTFRRIYWSFFWLVLCMVLYAAVASLALVKAIMAIFVCKDGEWDLSVGCIDFGNVTISPNGSISHT